MEVKDIMKKDLITIDSDAKISDNNPNLNSIKLFINSLVFFITFFALIIRYGNKVNYNKIYT